MNYTIKLPPPLEQRLKEMEHGPIGMAQEARRIRQHLLTCPKCIEEMMTSPSVDHYTNDKPE